MTFQANVLSRYLQNIHFIQTAEHTYFLADHGTISEIDNKVGHKPSLNKYWEMEIIARILSDLTGIRL